MKPFLPRAQMMEVICAVVGELTRGQACICAYVHMCVCAYVCGHARGLGSRWVIHRQGKVALMAHGVVKFKIQIQIQKLTYKHKYKQGARWAISKTDQAVLDGRWRRKSDPCSCHEPHAHQNHGAHHKAAVV